MFSFSLLKPERFLGSQEKKRAEGKGKERRENASCMAFKDQRRKKSVCSYSSYKSVSGFSSSVVPLNK